MIGLADILVAVILLLAVLIGAKRGLLRSLLHMASLFLSLLGAAWCASHLKDTVTQWIMPMVEKRVAEKTALADVGQKLPGFLSDMASDIQEKGQDFLLNTIHELLQPIVYGVLFLVSFLLLLLLLRLLTKVLRLVEKMPIIWRCNQLGGAALGLLSGVIFAAAALWLAVQFRLIPQESLDSSLFAKYFSLGMWIHRAV